MPRLLLTAALLYAAACANGGAGDRARLTQRERDSTIGASSLPGAGGVRRALGASDSAVARNARLDSVAANP
ncbi:MAG: hypothetical protein NVS1B4_19570 [Gemmatimonadaceae bacterium]